MNANNINSLLDDHNDLRLKIPQIKTEMYKGFEFEEEVIHLGIGGNWWQITIKDYITKVLIEKITAESFCEAIQKAETIVDEITSAIGA